MAETSYAPCGDLSLAYRVFGDGPVELVYTGSLVSHVELCWTVPEFKASMEQLSTFCRVVLFDKADEGKSTCRARAGLAEIRAESCHSESLSILLCLEARRVSAAAGLSGVGQ